MSREFIIGAMDLTPYFVRRETSAYVFRNVPHGIMNSLIAFSTSVNDTGIAVYIDPKNYFSTRSFTNFTHPRGLMFVAHYRGQRFDFLVLSPKATYWTEKGSYS